MIGEIIKIDPMKRSRNKNNRYIRVYFRLDKKKKRFAKMDLVPSFRNYRRWKRVLTIGNLIGDLVSRDKITIDADSRPILIEGLIDGKKIHKEKKLSIQELCKLGVFG